MSEGPIRLRWVATADQAASVSALNSSGFGPFELHAGEDADFTQPFDAWVLDAKSAAGDAWVACALHAAVIFHQTNAPTAKEALALVRRGAQDVVGPTPPQAMGRVIGLAVERKRLEGLGRHAYATDLATGLPHRTQLLEHMSHLLALREREPAPMALIVMRVEGLASVELRQGTQAMQSLRRKLAVRLRAGLRASDVVASVAEDSFAVLLAWIDSAADAQNVAMKLAHSVQQPVALAGGSEAVAAQVGWAVYPDHGREAAELWQRASSQSGGIATLGRGGFANFAERGPGQAANED
jgi:diguanylate cyclase (GGDEF)-like protein